MTAVTQKEFRADELSRGERCVRELTEMIGVEMPTVSRHLSLLKSAGILEDEKRGAHVFYRVRVPCVLNVFSCVKAIQSAHDNH
jgi:ArsR family transcriptional regulator